MDKPLTGVMGGLLIQELHPLNLITEEGTTLADGFASDDYYSLSVQQLLSMTVFSLRGRGALCVSAVIFSFQFPKGGPANEFFSVCPLLAAMSEFLLGLLF